MLNKVKNLFKKSNTLKKEKSELNKNTVSKMEEDEKVFISMNDFKTAFQNVEEIYYINKIFLIAMEREIVCLLLTQGKNTN
jgi:hypothetical protein